MTAYTTISNALVAVGAKPFSTTVTALRDNPIAITEGAAGAPRNVLGSLERLTAGTSIRWRSDAEQIVVNALAVLAFPSFFLQGGTITVAFEHRQSGGGTSTVTINRNRAGSSVTVATITETGTTYVAKTQNVDILPGDSLGITHANATGAGRESRIRNLRLQVGDGVSVFPVSQLGNWEGNPALS